MKVFEPKIFQTLKNYRKDATHNVSTDIMAGVIVGIVAIPLAIAFGIASGATPTDGLVTAIIAGFIISFLGGSKVQIGGPTGAFIIIVYGVIQQFGIGGLLIATIMAGILLILMGVFKLGNVIKFVPYPVIVGFTAGIAITIFSTQMNDLFGWELKNTPANFIDKWVFYFKNFPATNFWALGIGVFSILLIIFTPKISKKIPGSLIAIIFATIALWILKSFFGINTIQTIGDLYELPTGIPVPKLPDFQLDNGKTILDLITQLFPAAFTIAMLGAIESLLSAMVADGVIGDRHNSNTELIAQGAANIITPFFGGIPATGAIARTMTNINNGGRSPIAGIIHAVTLLLVLLFLGKLVGYIPMACLAGVLIMVSYNMSGWRTIVALRKNPKSDFAVMLTTLILTVLFDLTVAIEIGLLLAVVLFLKRTSEATSIKIFSSEIDPKAETDFALNEEKLVIPDGVEVYEIDGPYFFGIANKFDDIMHQVRKMPKIRVIRMRKVPFIDSTGLHNLETLCLESHRKGIVVILSGVTMQVRKTLMKAHFEKIIPEENICPHINVALAKAEEILSVES
ncbi:MAG: STAS domain-containing protein [Prevotellaceae bacterium]|jgi:SulP family sulfate permease|nr:STAS domain-containing protein [Prevotellaceae bacterium]